MTGVQTCALPIWRNEIGEASTSKKVGSTKATRERHGKNRGGNCHELGHTRKTCNNPSQPLPPRPPPKKPGRPKGENTMHVHPRKRQYTKSKVSDQGLLHFLLEFSCYTLIFP